MKKGILSLLALAAVSAAYPIFPNNRETGFGSVGRLTTLVNGRWETMGSAVAIGPNWLLCVAHTTGTHFEPSPGRRIPIIQRTTHTAPAGNADLAVLKLGSPVTTYSKIYTPSFTALRGQTVRLVGYGLTGVKTSVGWNITAASTGTKRWAQNVVDQLQTISVNIGSTANPNIKKSQYLLFDLDNPNGLTNGPLGGRAVGSEGGIADKDSGSPMFLYNAGEYKVVALNGLTGTLPNSGTDNPYAFGGVGFSVYLAPYRTWIRTVTGI